MASVTIDSGPPAATDRPYRIPKEKWFSLMQEKRSFLHINIKYDCRCLLDFIEDAEEMWEELGFTSRDDLIVNGYELDPSEVDLAAQWLKIKDPDFEVPLKDAIKAAREMPLAEHGGDRKSGTVKEEAEFARENPLNANQGSDATLIKQDRGKNSFDNVKPVYETGNHKAREMPLAEKAGAPVGNQNAIKLEIAAARDDPLKNNSSNTTIVSKPDRGKAYLLRRMARDFPDHLDKLESGEFKSARQAAIACGIVKVKTPLEIAIFAFEKLTIEEKVIFNQKIQEHLDV